jgi:biopolymer transport protein ExbD
MHIIALVLGALTLTPLSASQTNPIYVQSKQEQSREANAGPSSAQTIEEGAVVVAIVSEDEIYIDKVKINRPDVAEEVDKRLRLLPAEDRIVYIKVMPEVSYNTLTGIIDEIKARGYDRIGLVADRSQEQRKTARATASSAVTSAKGAPKGVEQSSVNREQLVITVYVIGQGRIGVMVGETRVPLRELERNIRARLKGSANKSVLILAPAAVTYGSIVSVIEATKAGGADVVGLSLKQQ